MRRILNILKTLDLTHLTQEKQPMTQNVHKPKPSDMCDAIRQAVKTMESYLSDSEIKEMIVCDKGACSGQQRGL